jgi:D-serine deaminase-like pyridoxal phosphate-dependent protein
MNNYYEHLCQLNIDYDKSQLLLNLDALDKNIEYINNNSKQKKIRLATKSLRSIEVMQYLEKKIHNFFGWMTYSTEEALWLRQKGFTNLLVGYPKWDKISLKELSHNSEHITLMIDNVSQLRHLSEYAKTQMPFRLCLDIDLSLDLPFLRFGVYRSPIQSIHQLQDIVQYLKSHSEFVLVGLMGYEAQIAGVGDKHHPIIQFLKKLSLPQLRKRRKELLAFLKQKGFAIEIINGGGSGSLKSTREEEIVTEITIGSALYAPALFDHYNDVQFTPSLFYSLPIIRKPTEHIYTCFGGGYIASGSIGKERAPVPYLPMGLKLLSHEGAGEVQTPVFSKTALPLDKPIFFRYAKAGELCERFNEIIAFRDQKIIKRFLTYRGEGKVFI